MCTVANVPVPVAGLPTGLLFFIFETIFTP
jgi:hypothetical protein